MEMQKQLEQIKDNFNRAIEGVKSLADLEKIEKIQADWKEALNNCSNDEAALKKCEECRKIMYQYPLYFPF